MNILITHSTEKKLCGKTIQTTIAAQETSKLWRPFREAIKKKLDLAPNLFYSISRYGVELAKGEFTIDGEFEKCAAIEASLSNCPTGFEEVILDGGLYAVFLHRGAADGFPATMQEFLQHWLPKSDYILDSRNHFETFDQRYDPFSSRSVETIYIPLKEAK